MSKFCLTFYPSLSFSFFGNISLITTWNFHKFPFSKFVTHRTSLQIFDFFQNSNFSLVWLKKLGPAHFSLSFPFDFLSLSKPSPLPLPFSLARSLSLHDSLSQNPNGQKP
jgi:hypothetical protein